MLSHTTCSRPISPPFQGALASFPHGTCALSISRQHCVALDHIYDPIQPALSNKPTRRTWAGAPAIRAAASTLVLAYHYLWYKRGHSCQNPWPQHCCQVRVNTRTVPTTHKSPASLTHSSRTLAHAGFRLCYSPCSLAVTGGISVDFCSSAY